MKRFRLVACGLLLLPAFLTAQKREDILSIQRDVAQLQDQVKQMQTSQDAKLASLEALLKQALEQNSKLAAGMESMQKNVGDRLNEQQTKLVQPLAMMGAKVDQAAEDARTVRENLGDLTTRLGNLDNKLSDISSAVRTLGQAPVAPPPPAGGATPGAAIPAPVGVSAESLWQNAFRDYSTAKDDLAMMEFSDFLKYFPTAENAAAAQYYIGALYDRAKQYDDAVKSFDAVLERYPDNPKTPDAMYMKGVDLMKGGKRAEASTTFKEFLAAYPTHSLARNAQTHLREVGSSGTPAARAKKK
jgi:TolA-binding protein